MNVKFLYVALEDFVKSKRYLGENKKTFDLSN